MTEHDRPAGDGQTLRTVSFDGDRYRTTERRPGILGRVVPRLSLYGQFITIVWRAAGQAKRDAYGYDDWIDSSVQVLEAVESVGVRIEVEGVEHLRGDEPAVIIGNHMSTLETVVLPAIIGSVRPVTFVLKDSLFTTPIFGHVASAVEAIGVTRTNPRADLKTVMEQGGERLSRGKSIVVFPQTTRTFVFDPAHFSSIGVKLAQRAKVPVIPLALTTKAWANGKLLKDFGPVDRRQTARFRFGAPIPVEGRGAEEHQRVIEFIQTALAEWESGPA